MAYLKRFMPEGPSIVILKEAVQPFVGKKIIHASGNAKINIPQFKNKKVTDFKSWGKHFLICVENFTIRIHLLMFGSYTINEKKDKTASLSFEFSNGEINFYTASVKLLEDTPDKIYDWEADVMNDNWNAKKAKEKLKNHSDSLVCDVLLDQNIFAGVGNIIKNEVLYILKIHPKSIVGKIPNAKLNAIVKEARDYSFDFLKWKKQFELKKHWLAHNKSMCTRCNIPFTREHIGKTHRRSFFCNNCQKLYD